MTVTVVVLSVESDASLRSPERVRAQRETARVALARCAERHGAPARGWTQRPDGAPLPHGQYHWSISHKPALAAAAIAESPVGIDLEPIAPRPRELHAAVADDDEWTVIGDRSWHSFFRLWTAKEAVLKANGFGVGRLGACRLVERLVGNDLALNLDGASWCVQQGYLLNHVVAVATEKPASIAWNRP